MEIGPAWFLWPLLYLVLAIAGAFWLSLRAVATLGSLWSLVGLARGQPLSRASAVSFGLTGAIAAAISQRVGVVLFLRGTALHTVTAFNLAVAALGLAVMVWSLRQPVSETRPA